MVKWMFKEEMCDVCKEIKPLKEISRLKGKLIMMKGVCSINPVKAICKECDKNFSSGIVIAKENFKTSEFRNNIHICPFCGFKNVASKEDYSFLL